MAEKYPDIETREDKIAEAKKFYARGYRNYVVGDFNEAAEDLSRSCELYAELYGDESEEVAIPSLFYGKTLIELAQMGENKVIALPDIEEEGDDSDEYEGQVTDEKQDGMDDDDDDDDDESSNDKDVCETKTSNSKENGSSSSSTFDPQPGTSSGISNNSGENAEAEANENLQFAWEALEMAARVFKTLGSRFEEYLAEAHYGLGEILMENQNCSEAIRDYNIAFDIFSKLEPIKERCLAEIKYKTGLCNYSSMAYDDAIVDFETSARYMNQVIETEKTKEQTPEIQKTIEDLTSMREDIINKIVEVQETKQLLRNKLMSNTGGYTALLAEDVKSGGAGGSQGGSSSGTSEKAKANDISHLVKRKAKTDETANNTNELSPPAKKKTP